jgi:hypothetical protein
LRQSCFGNFSKWASGRGQSEYEVEHPSTHTHSRMHANTLTCLHPCTNTNSHSGIIHTQSHKHMHTHKCSHPCMHTHTCMHTRTRTRSHTRSHTHRSSYILNGRVRNCAEAAGHPYQVLPASLPKLDSHRGDVGRKWGRWSQRRTYGVESEDVWGRVKMRGVCAGGYLKRTPVRICEFRVFNSRHKPVVYQERKRCCAARGGGGEGGNQ